LRFAPPTGQHDQELLAEVGRVQQMCEHYTRAYEDHLRSRLAESGFDPSRSSARFAQSLDLITGRKQLYLQQPKQFYERALFPWLSALESATDDIAAELQTIFETESAFQPYVESVTNRPRPDTLRMTNNRDWTAFYLWKNGAAIEENVALFPKTMRALEGVPHFRTERTPSILFSRLKPGAHIPPHFGYINARLICHLPLVIPEGCAFRVGNDVRPWERGKAFVFDDTIEHEAWNNSKETRVVLLFEIWRPELTEEERGLVTALLNALRNYSEP
jgi:aspartyl/asparaginyl beta-hydroxylase (cupin superfamily)